jgi:hypothetical protein
MTFIHAVDVYGDGRSERLIAGVLNYPGGVSFQIIFNIFRLRPP